MSNTVSLKTGWTYYNFATIPAHTLNGAPIHAIVQNNSASNALSRLYCEQNSELRMIGPYCFDQYSTLTYFEFPTTLRQICQYAFRLTAIENQVLGSDNTIYIGTYAFNQALRGSYIKVPGSINMLDTRIGTYCSGLQDGWTLQIGDSAHYSYLDLSKYNGGNLITINDRAAFVQNPGIIVGTVEFYSKHYSSFDAFVDSNTVLEHLFGDNVPYIGNNLTILQEGQG